MSRQTKAEQADRTQALTQLREWIKPGATVYTILDHVSSSGMSRAIRVLVPIVGDGNGHGPAGTVDFIHPNYAVGKALGLRHWKRNGREQDALVMGGCGMDMGFHLVYELSHTLYGTRQCSGCQRRIPSDYPTNVTCGECDGEIVGGYRCLGKGCPSNYHANHRQSESGPERFDLLHTDGYALRHRWL